MSETLTDLLAGHNAALGGVVASYSTQWQQFASLVAQALRGGNRLFFAGNGGSACDAMHIAGEFVGRFVGERPSLPAIALTADSGIISAIANDYGYDHVFARQLEGLAREGDIFIAMSTSGSSKNIVQALQTAQKIGMRTMLLTGEKARNLPPLAEHIIIVPSLVTAHIQEAHLFLLHAMAGMVEKELNYAV